MIMISMGQLIMRVENPFVIESVDIVCGVLPAV